MANKIVKNMVDNGNVDKFGQTEKLAWLMRGRQQWTWQTMVGHIYELSGRGMNG